MRILLLTVAGMSTRFSKSIGRPVLKCIYSERQAEDTLLFKMINRHKKFDKIVIVGGYQFELLKNFLDEYFSDIAEKIILINNEHYEKYGSGYSFYKGVDAIRNMPWSELVFAEGDLFVDDVSFDFICDINKDVISFNYLPIESDKSVVVYLDLNGKPHYIYDTNHAALCINEEFIAIYNSAQIWKFTNVQCFNDSIASMSEKEFRGTNLLPINKYYQTVDGEIEYVGFSKWINCNTVEDYRKSLEKE